MNLRTSTCLCKKDSYKVGNRKLATLTHPSAPLHTNQIPIQEQNGKNFVALYMHSRQQYYLATLLSGLLRYPVSTEITKVVPIPFPPLLIAGLTQSSSFSQWIRLSSCWPSFSLTFVLSFLAIRFHFDEIEWGQYHNILNSFKLLNPLLDEIYGCESLSCRERMNEYLGVKLLSKIDEQDNSKVFLIKLSVESFNHFRVLNCDLIRF